MLFDTARLRHASVSALAAAALVVVPVVTLAAPLSSQTFQRFLGASGDDRGAWIAPTLDGGYALLGTRDNGAWVVKVSANGVRQWETVIGSNVGCFPTHGLVTSSNRIVVVGSGGGGAPPWGIFAAQVSPTGQLEWNNVYHGTPGSTNGPSIEPLPGGDFVIAGALQMPPQVMQAPMLMGLDGSSGSVQWVRYYVDSRWGANTFGALTDVHARSITDVVACGWTQNGPVQPSTRDSIVLKTTSISPVLAWSKAYPIANHDDMAFGLEPAANGDWFVTGFTKSVGEGGGSYLMRIGDDGLLAWYDTFRYFGAAGALKEDLANGHVVVAGTATGDAALLATDGNGLFQWCRNYGGTMQGVGQCVERGASGWYLVGFDAGFGAGSNDLQFVRTDWSGGAQCHVFDVAPEVATPPVTPLDLSLGFIADLGEQSFALSSAAPATLETVLCADASYAPFCPGSGLLPTLCPCSNFGAAGRGCANSVNASGALLAASGTPDPDTLALSASGMPSILTPAAIFLQGDAQSVAGLVFGDGVRCIDGNLVRIGTKATPGGSALYPETGNLSVSVKGGVVPGSGAVRWYQTYYRNAAATFCPPATFNVTNGVEVVW